jgi:hypothetical protein
VGVWGLAGHFDELFAGCCFLKRFYLLNVSDLGLHFFGGEEEGKKKDLLSDTPSTSA